MRTKGIASTAVPAHDKGLVDLINEAWNFASSDGCALMDCAVLQ